MQILAFLLDSVASFFCTLFLLRFLMQAMRVSFAGQIGDFIIKLTNWAVLPLRRLIPGIRGFDWASLIAALLIRLLIQLLLAAILVILAGPVDRQPDAILLMALWFSLRALLRSILYIFICALLLQAVLSWINPYSPIAGPIRQLTRSLLAPIQRVIPPISGIDLSPLVVILLLQAALMLL